jgi:hypothetical protein
LFWVAPLVGGVFGGVGYRALTQSREEAGRARAAVQARSA